MKKSFPSKSPDVTKLSSPPSAFTSSVDLERADDDVLGEHLDFLGVEGEEAEPDLVRRAIAADHELIAGNLRGDRGVGPRRAEPRGQQHQ